MRHSRLFRYVLVLFLLGCGPDPEKAGDACDPDDGCPAGLICAPLGDDTICQIPEGAACDPQAEEDFCVGDSICGATAEGGGVCGIPEGGTCNPAQSHCAGELVCAELEAGGHACYPPVLVRGMVFDAETTTAIEGAHVLALDDQASAVSHVAITDVAGNYSLAVPVPRDASGAPAAGTILTLRASAHGYQTFPGGIRTALPINSSEAKAEEGGWAIQTAITDIALIALPSDQQGLASISGTVQAGAESGGVLVVAEDGSGSAVSAISDLDGGYTIFNVPDGSYTVRGYAAGVQLVPATADVAGVPLTGVDLLAGSEALGTVTGSVNIVNAPGGSATSVVLVVESTFNDTFVRGEVPRGLRTPLSGPPDVQGAFSIQGVPPGDYVVLAAFENDLLVRDPDQGIAGTDIVRITMPSPGTDVAAGDFKVTEALAVRGPGQEEPEAVSGNVTLTWADDSSEDFYTVVVFNAFGDVVWCQADDNLLPEAPNCDGPSLDSVSGNSDVSVTYGGPLEPGMYYQFRATSWRMGSPISQTEDLRGVFFVEGM